MDYKSMKNGCRCIAVILHQKFNIAKCSHVTRILIRTVSSTRNEQKKIEIYCKNDIISLQFSFVEHTK